MNRKTAFPALLAIFATLTMLVSACGAPTTTAQSPAETAAPAVTQEAPSTEASAPPAPAILRVGAASDDYRQDPADPGRVTIGMVATNANIFESLTTMDNNYQVQPLLAESWEYDAAKGTWTFRLRQGVTFHNGAPFNSASVVEMIRRVAQGGYANVAKVGADSAVAVDDFTVDITPTTQNLTLPASLAHPIFGIAAPGTNLLEEQIGTGPFKMVEYVKGDHITVEKNTSYWGDAPKVDRIEFRFYPDATSRVLALEAGDVDVIYDLAPASAVVLAATSGFQVIESPVSAYQALSVLVTGKAPYTAMQDAKVREAIGYAIDRSAIINSVYSGFATDSQTVVPAGVLGAYADKVVGYTFDAAKAQALLDEAGWIVGEDGYREKAGQKLHVELVSGYPDGPTNGLTPEVIQAQLKNVGVMAVVTSLPDDPSYEARLTEKQGDLWVEIGNQNNPTPCFLLSFMWYGRDPAPNIWETAFGPAYIGFTAFDDEVEACLQASDPAQAQEHAANAMHIMIDQARTAIPLVGVYRIWGASDKVIGFEPSPVMIYVRWDKVSLAP